jgi:hypothetical protein
MPKIRAGETGCFLVLFEWVMQTALQRLFECD